VARTGWLGEPRQKQTALSWVFDQGFTLVQDDLPKRPAIAVGFGDPQQSLPVRRAAGKEAGKN